MATDTETVYQFAPEKIGGKAQSLEDYKGKVILIVNTASKCGLTPQLEGLEELYKKYQGEGFEVLGFPSNQFQGQEPLEGEAISEFCQVNYGVSFPIFDKIKVKGDDPHPLYSFLGDKKRNGATSAKPKWNFHKYLIGRDGRVLDYFLPITNPTAKRVHKAIEKALEKGE